MALILAGIPMASMQGAPLSGFVLGHIHWLGLSSWGWLLIREGLPAVTSSYFARMLLPNGPDAARFLSDEEKAWVTAQLELEQQQKAALRSLSVVHTIFHRRIWHLACIGFVGGFGGYSFNFWLPLMMRSILAGRSNAVVGLGVMILNLPGVIAMIFVSRHSDRTLERRYHLAASVVLAGVGMMLLGAPRPPLPSVVLLSAVAMGLYSSFPVFISMPGEFLTGFSAAAGVALVTSVSSIGGFVGPYTFGLIRQRTGNSYCGLICAGILLLISAILALMLPKQVSVSS